MAVAAAVLAALCISLIIFHLHNLQDSSRGEPVRAEEARVHAKENCHSRAGSSYYLYFHVPCRDTVVTCQVPPDIWYYLSKGDRGTLCHQGGRFISFTRDGELIAVDPGSGISCGGYTARNTKILLLFPCILGIIVLSSSGTSRPENHGLPIAKEAASYEVLHL